MWWIPISSHSPSSKTQLRVGRLTKAHGLKGAIKVELYTDDPEHRFTPGATFQLQVPTGSPWHGKNLELIELKWYNSHAVAFFKDVPDRSAAEALVKAILWVEQDPTELPVEDDAWYDHQLVGLSVIRDGVKVGVLSRVDHNPAQDLLFVTTDSGDVLVPFVKAFVPAVDITAGTITVTPPPGLFEELPEEDLPLVELPEGISTTEDADDDEDAPDPAPETGATP